MKHFIILIALFLTSCSAGPESGGKGASGVDPMLHRDLSHALSKAQSLTFTSPAEDFNGVVWADILRSKLTKAASKPGTASYTEKEKVAVGYWLTPDGLPVSLVGLSMLTGSYAARYGRAPRHAYDLFPELNTPQGRAEFNAMSDEEVLTKYCAMINPITGKLHSSLQCGSEWVAGGINVEWFGTPEQVAALGERGYYHAFPDGSDSGFETVPVLYKNAVRIALYGERPGSVIFDDYFYTR